MSASPSPSSSPPPVPPPATRPNSTSTPPPPPVPPPATQPNSTSTPSPPPVPPPATQPNSTSTPPPPPVPPPATQPNSTSTPPPPPTTTTTSPPPSATPPSPTLASPPRATPLVPPPASSPPQTVPASPPLLSSPPLARPPSQRRPPTPSTPPTIQPEAPPLPPPTRNSSVPAPPTLSLPAPNRPSSNPPPSNPSDSPDTAASDVASGNGSGIGTGGLVGISVVVVAALLLIVGIIWLLRRRKKREEWDGNGYVVPSPYGSSNMSDSSLMKSPASGAAVVGKSFSRTGYPYSPSEQGGLGNSRSWFTYEELLHVTSGFSEYNILGQGGFGPVYKGRLPEGREVAVKQLKDGGNQGEREFRAEVEIISRIHHRHLVSLVGYCIHENQRLLVYDYVPNGTLHYHLHGRKQSVMDWATRVKIAAGAAKGIAYLHEDCHPRIIHRDIKSSNILLDNNFEAQVSDFGLAKLALDTFTHVSTRVMGTFGYLAPEYASSGKLTEKSDVYSFGVVLLELITGRKPVDTTQPLGDESLVEWARPLLSQALESRNVESVVDPKLGRNYVEPEMLRMIEAAAACVRHSATKRPGMGQVVRALDSIPDLLDLNNGIQPGESEFFDSAQQSDIRFFQRMAFGSHEFDSDFSQASWRTKSREV